MTEPPGPPVPTSDESGRPERLSRRDRRRILVRALARPALIALVLVFVYFLLPLDHVGDLTAAFALAAGIVVVIALGWWQIRRIMAAEYPAVQAIEALTTVVVFYLVLFATVFFRMSVVNPGSFDEPLSRIDALYFCLTVFSTVGFGVVTVQMVLNLILIALGIRLVTAAVQWRRRHRGAG